MVILAKGGRFVLSANVGVALEIILFPTKFKLQNLLEAIM